MHVYAQEHTSSIYIYIYIHAKLNFLGSQKSMVLDRFLDRFWIGFWRGFGEVFSRFLEIILISISYYSAYHAGTDLGRNLEVILIDFRRYLYSFWSDFRVYIGRGVPVI